MLLKATFYTSFHKMLPPPYMLKVANAFVFFCVQKNVKRNRVYQSTQLCIIEVRENDKIKVLSLTGKLWLQ